MQLALILLAVGLVAADQPPQEAQPVVPVVAQAEPAVQVVGVHQHNGQSFPGEHHTHEHHQVVSHEPSNHHESVAHYAPSGVIQVVGQQQPAASDKPQVSMMSRPQYAPPGEQYGQPESQALPPNYKPFGSWGLYIGGNPADGYYSNYYKALGNSVADKQQVNEQVRPVVSPSSSSSSSSSGIGQASAFGPILKQASSFNPSYADQVYPSYTDYYTPADLNSGAAMPSVYASSQRAIVSPVQAGAQVYGAPISYSPEPLTYSTVDSYAATKRVGSVKSEQQPQQQQQQVKGQQQQQYHYRYAAAPAVAQQQQVYHYQPQQVVAYPVPVGSQIVGSQPGVEGAYQPYGVHGYTRYAIKPTVVASEQSYYQQHSSPVAHYPIYKQQQQYQPVAYQPLSFYGYPLSQLHYSQGSIVPAFGQQSQTGVSAVQSSPAVVSEHQHHHQHQQQGHAPVVGQVEAASSDKSETSEAAVNKQQQKKA